jgi:hypothetical protein
MSTGPIPFRRDVERPLFDAENHVRAAAEFAAVADQIMQTAPEHLSRDVLLGLMRIVSQIATHTRAVRDAWNAEHGEQA